MKENLEELNQRGMAARWPVILGGAALTRAYVEQDLAEVYAGEVRYARDAFEGLRLMDAMMAVTTRGARRRAARAAASAGSRATAPAAERRAGRPAGALRRRDRQHVPTPPFWGDRVVKGIALADYVAYLDERATFMGQWGLRATRGGDGPSYEELVETEGRPRLRAWLERMQTENLLEAAVVYGYFPCVSEGDDLIILDQPGAGRGRGHPLHVPAPAPRPVPLPGRLLPAGGVRRGRRGRVHARDDGVAGQRGDRRAVRADAYRDYLELHGLSVQLTEALAECWHARVRERARLRRRGRRRARRHAQAGLPRLALLLRLPGLPGPGGPGQARRAARARTGSASSCPRSSSCTPSSPPTRWSSTTPRRSTSTPADRSVGLRGSLRSTSTSSDRSQVEPATARVDSAAVRGRCADLNQRVDGEPSLQSQLLPNRNHVAQARSVPVGRRSLVFPETAGRPLGRMQFVRGGPCDQGQAPAGGISRSARAASWRSRSRLAAATTTTRTPRTPATAAAARPRASSSSPARPSPSSSTARG